MNDTLPGLHPQLMLLLEIQDLRSQQRELAERSGMEELEAEHFHIDVEEAASEINKKVEELEAKLEPQVRSRYERVKASMTRVVAPVIGGVCYGCFVSIPAATAADQSPNESVRSCQNCGRFIYVLS